MHRLDGLLALAFHPIAVGRQRCAAMDSSRGGRRSYPFSSAPSTDVRAAEAEGRMRVGGMHRYRELVMNFGEEEGQALAGGLMFKL